MEWIIKLSTETEELKKALVLRDFTQDLEDKNLWFWQNKIPIYQDINRYSDEKYIYVMAYDILDNLGIPDAFYDKYLNYDRLHKYYGIQPSEANIDLDDLVDICEEAWEDVQTAVKEWDKFNPNLKEI